MLNAPAETFEISFQENPTNQRISQSRINPVSPITPERHLQLLQRVQVEKERKSLKTPNGSPVMISYEHLQRHFRGSGVLGASITKWGTVEEMLLDPDIWNFVVDSVSKIPKLNPGEERVFSLKLDKEIGYEGIVSVDNLPDGSLFEVTFREGYYVNVTNVSPPPTNTLNIMIIRDAKNPAQYLLHSAWSGSVEGPRGSLKNPDWKNFAFYSENV